MHPAGVPRCRCALPDAEPVRQRRRLRPLDGPAEGLLRKRRRRRRPAPASDPSTPPRPRSPPWPAAAPTPPPGLVDKLSKLVKATANVDFTNAAFLRQYAVVFAASTVLTLILWLLAVAKRAIRGVPLTEALTEAIGFLWLTVLASAFTPLILYTVVSATDGVTDVIAAGTGGQTRRLLRLVLRGPQEGRGHRRRARSC